MSPAGVVTPRQWAASPHPGLAISGMEVMWEYISGPVCDPLEPGLSRGLAPATPRFFITNHHDGLLWGNGQVSHFVETGCMSGRAEVFLRCPIDERMLRFDGLEQ